MPSSLEGAPILTSEELRKKKENLLRERSVVTKAAQHTATALKKAGGDLEKLKVKMESLNEAHASSHGTISEKEYREFLEKGMVSEVRLAKIAEKLHAKEKLDPAEQDIADKKRDEIKKITENKWPEIEPNTNIQQPKPDDVDPIVDPKAKKSSREAAKEAKELESVNSKLVDEFNINPDAVSFIKDMTVGQKQALIHNLRHTKADLIQQKAEDMYEKKVSVDMLTRVGSWFVKAAKIESLKKKAEEEIKKVGAAAYGKELEIIAQSIKNTGLEGAGDSGSPGGIRIEYASGFENLTPEEKKIFENFNREATYFGSMPSEWGFDTSSKWDKALTGRVLDWHNKEYFDQAEKSYTQEREKLNTILLSKFGNDAQKVTDYLRMIDANIDFNQRISKDPDAMKSAAIAKQFGIVTKKGALPAASMLVGALARGGAATAGVANYGAVLIAPAMGALRGFFKGREAVRQTLAKARAGIRDADVKDTTWNKLTGNVKERELKGQLLAKFRAAEEKTTIRNVETGKTREISGGLRGKVKLAWKSFESAQNDMLALEQALATVTPEEKGALEKEYATVKEVFAMRQGFLANRIAIAQEALDQGTIDFGKKEDQFNNNYTMQNEMNKAYALLLASPLAQYQDLKGKEASALKDISERFEKKFGDLLKEKGLIADRAKKSLINLAMIKSATTGLIFGGLGFKAREVWNEYGEDIKEFLHISKGIPVDATVDLKSGIPAGTPAGNGAMTQDSMRNFSHGDISEGVGKGFQASSENNPEWTHNPDGSITQNSAAALENHGEPIGPAISETLRHGITKEFSIKLGENGVPSQLERVFNEISMDHMHIIDGQVNEEVATKSLNVAANLVKLAEGHNVLGVSATNCGFEYDSAKGILKITNHAEFNKNLEILEKHSNILRKSGGLKGALIDNIKPGTWLHIAHADGLDKVHDIASGQEVSTGIVGHDNLDQNNITNFQKSDVAQHANQIHHADLTGPRTKTGDLDIQAIGNNNTPSGDLDITKIGTTGNGDDLDITKIPDRPQGTIQQPSQKVPIEKTTASSTGPSAVRNGPPQEIPDDQGGATTKPKIDEKVTLPKEELVKTIPPEIQTKNILEHIFKTNDIAESKMWDDIKGDDLNNFMSVSKSEILEYRNKEIPKLWSFMKVLKANSGVEVMENEKTGEYLQRASKIYLGQSSKNNLDVLMKIAEENLKTNTPKT